MKIVGIRAFGGPEVLEVLDVPEPHAGPGEVRIRVHAAAVSPTDTVLRSGAQDMGGQEPPYIPGMDAAGVVDEVGEGAGWRIGDEVMALALPRAARRGAYAEYLVAPSDSIARIPAGVGLEAAATLPMNGLTAVQTLEKLDLAEGSVLAITGAAGTLGNYLIQLAKEAGLTVVADASPRDAEVVTALGADHVVERGDDVADRIRELFPDGVDAVADAAVMNELAAGAVRDGGGFATVRGWDGHPGRGITVHPIRVAEEYSSGVKLDRLRALAEADLLSLRIADVLPAERAADAHRRLEAGGLRGRIVLTF
ncbi:NADP-dependent oxidoreductase [Arthrobacter sp. zg-Y238]|uniref:NADP-dependent oxidoreductase n=1 Tax=Arthrobacter sp. zg-Y238 TaxID=2964614 RepID=UPI0021055701|nr:NADP-dependent oxidoreductase [Arthrobacter sp. zg-Y238]MCQ1953947.1 NADP-dependent oxidoreductase [Arthrobacter sp. zg-Y238]